MHTQGGAHKRRFVAVQESCYLRGVRGLAPASSVASRLSSEASRSELRSLAFQAPICPCHFRVPRTFSASHTTHMWLQTLPFRVFFVSRGPEEVSRGIPYTPGGGRQGGGGRALISHIYIYIWHMFTNVSTRVQGHRGGLGVGCRDPPPILGSENTKKKLF